MERQVGGRENQGKCGKETRFLGTSCYRFESHTYSGHTPDRATHSNKKKYVVICCGEIPRYFDLITIGKPKVGAVKIPPKAHHATKKNVARKSWAVFTPITHSGVIPAKKMMREKIGNKKEY